MKNKHIKRIVEILCFTDGSSKTVISEPDKVGLLWPVDEKETTAKVNSTYTIPKEYVNPWDWYYPYTVPPPYTYPCPDYDPVLKKIYELLVKILEEIERGNKKD